MKIHKFHIHNFRSIADADISVDDYGLLVGENNSGKSNVLTALRIFYEDGGSKFSEATDFPKFSVSDKDSWIEISYLTTQEEQDTLKEEYRSTDRILKVRKYLKSSDKEVFKASQSNIYAYEGQTLSKNLFYGAKNISEAKLGKVIFIPEISKIDDTFKLSGPSPFREMVNFVMKKVVQDSPSFANLTQAFSHFNVGFKDERSKDGVSMQSVIDEINSEISHWHIKFNVSVNAIRPEDIVKSLFSHNIEDSNFRDNTKFDISSYGQGLQRHLIYTLIKLSAKYNDSKSDKKKDFSPDFTLILFEEPEAFLHPSQQEQLNSSLRLLAQSPNQQVLITTHSPIFVSKNTEDMRGLVRIHKAKTISSALQLGKDDITTLCASNTGLGKMFTDLLNADTTSAEIKKKIREKRLNITDDTERMFDEEAIKYFMWLDSERCSAFFAKHVVICEGATEKVLLDHLTKTAWLDEFKDRHIYFLDALGKFNVHRFMNLFGRLEISHSILIDSDQDRDVHGYINSFLDSAKNEHTKAIRYLDPDIEGFLGIEAAKRRDQKPLNVMSHYRSKKIPEEKLAGLKSIVMAIA